MQDLKTGNIVGSTPWKQQVMQIVGVVVPALVLPLILSLILQAYGIGDPTEEVGVLQALETVIGWI